MKKLIVLGFVTIFSSGVNADTLFTPAPFGDWKYTASYNFFTIHRHSDTYKSEKTDEEIEWNESNKIGGFRVSVNENVGYFYGTGKNSYYEDTHMGGVELSTSDREWEIGSDIGIATGYEEMVSVGTLPFVNPFVRYNYHFSYGLYASLKVGSMNFMAENAHFEISKKF